METVNIIPTAVHCGGIADLDLSAGFHRSACAVCLPSCLVC